MSVTESPRPSKGRLSRRQAGSEHTLSVAAAPSCLGPRAPAASQLPLLLFSTFPPTEGLKGTRCEHACESVLAVLP